MTTTENPPPEQKPDTSPNDNIIAFRPRTDEPKQPKNKPPPMVNLPPATKALAGILLFTHLAIQILTYTVFPDAENAAIALGALIPAQWTGSEPFSPETPLTLLTFSLLHGGWLHLGVNLLMLVSIGGALEKTLGRKKFLMIYIVSTLFAGIGHIAFNSFSPAPVVGASGGISGLFGAMIVLMQRNKEATFGQQSQNGLLPVVMLWILISAVFGYLGAPDGSPVAWIAHIGGFLAGVALMMLPAKSR